MAKELVEYPRFRWLVLLSACMGIGSAQAAGVALAPLLPEIASDLQIDAGTVTTLMTAFVLSASISLIIGGFLCDRYGIMPVLILGILCGSVPASLMPWIGSSYKAVFFARLIQGASIGFSMGTMAPIIALWFPPQEKGLASGLMGGSLSLASAVGVLAAPALYMFLHSWQQMVAWLSVIGWVSLAIAFVVVIALKPLSLPSNLEIEKTRRQNQAAFRQALFLLVTWVGIVSVFFSQWTFQSLYGLVPAFLAAAKPMGAGFGPMKSGQLMLAVMIAGMVGPIAGGILQDKVFRGSSKTVMLLGFLVSGVSIYAIGLPAVYESTFFLVICLIFAGAGVMMILPAVSALVAATYPIQIVGGMLGLWLGLGSFGGVLGLFVSGLGIARYGNYAMAITLTALAASVGFVLTMFITAPKVKDQVKENE